MSASQERVARAFDHLVPDRTPLFEMFWPCHPIHWDICGRDLATDAAMHWDASADCAPWEEFVEQEAQAKFKMARFFGLDVVHVGSNRARSFKRPTKVGDKRWSLDRAEYVFDERTRLVRKDRFSAADSDSNKVSEEQRRKEIEEWDGSAQAIRDEQFAVFRRVRQLAEADGLDWMYMGEVGAGTGVAFYPPFQLMWFVSEPDLLRRWIRMNAVPAFRRTEALIAEGCRIIAIGGDVSGDKGPFCSPAHYHEFILPVIQEHVNLIHRLGAKAVYTSDGNHWAIRDDFFFNSNIDGYKEVDWAAGMTFERLIEEGVAQRVCIIGNVDARHTLCQGTVEEVKAHVRRCLELGQKTPGGHILQASHSVHEDVKVENYRAVVNAYRDFFGMEPLPS